MISEICLVIGIAVLCYIAIPEISLKIRALYRHALIREFKAAAVSVMQFSSINPDGTLYCKAGAQTMRLDPGRTRFFLADPEKGLESVNWKSVHLIVKGTALLVFQGAKSGKKILCILPGKNGYAAQLPAKPEIFIDSRAANPVRIISSAVAVFAEFILFLHFSANPMLRNAAIAALIGIFGEVIPFSPPGLFLTMAADKFLKPGAHRNQAAAGTLFTLGVLLNVALIYFIIRLIAFGSLL